MSATNPELELQGCIVNIETEEAIAISFTDFDDLNQFIEENPSEYDGFSLEGAKASYRLVPEGTPLNDDEESACFCDALFDWKPLSDEEIHFIVEDHQSGIDVETMNPRGVPCILRLYVEDMDSNLLMKRNFASFSELNAFIAANPDLDVLTDCSIPVATLGIVETAGGKPCRVPFVITEDDGLGIPWEEQKPSSCKRMMSIYRRGFAEREKMTLRRLSKRDQESLASDEPRLEAELLFALVHNLMRKRYGVTYAQTGGLIGSWEDEESPIWEDFELVFDDHYEFPIPLPRFIPYSQTFCKITSTAELYDNDKPRDELKALIEKKAGAAFEELGVAVMSYVDAAMNEWTLKTLLEWSEALPERP